MSLGFSIINVPDHDYEDIWNAEVREVFRKCPVCHKKFMTIGEDWGYKRKRRPNDDRPVFYCSYGCMRVQEVPALHKEQMRIAKDFQE